MIGYKVVSGKKSFRPATSLALQRIRYRIGETTEQDLSEYGPFAVFDDLSSARKFAENHGQCILLVEFEESNQSMLWKKNPPIFSRNRTYSRGYSTSSGGITEKNGGFPLGTLFARSITPIRVIQEHEIEEGILASIPVAA